jgi:uncharacterized protein (DUF924 family)
MSSLNSTSQKDVDTLISFWFTKHETDTVDLRHKWFMTTPGFDDEIRDNFAGLVQQARANELDSWTEEPESTLALLLLLDQVRILVQDKANALTIYQFPRNLFRGSGESFSSDSKAADIATAAIAKGFPKTLPPYQQLFCYIPLLHAESLVHQIAAVALYEGMASNSTSDAEYKEFFANSILSAEKHRDVIMQFGRFPGRNKAIGRESTPEEIEFLKDHPYGL